MKMDPKKYYDAFSDGYDSRRHAGYHAMLDDLEAELVNKYCTGRTVLDAGCGTGLVLSRVAPLARRVVGVDLSGGMLSKARTRAGELAQGSLTQLPFLDSSFDAAYSFKVLAHVPDIGLAVREMARVVRPGGHLILEFYNPYSVRGLLWAVKRPGRIAQGVNEQQVHVRFDTPSAARSYFPHGWRVVESRGIRVVTPFAQALTLPLVGSLIERAEHRLAKSPARFFGSFYCVVAQNQN